MAPSVQTVPQMARRKWLACLVLQAIFSERCSGKVEHSSASFCKWTCGTSSLWTPGNCMEAFIFSPRFSDSFGWFLVLETLYPFLIRAVTSPLIYFNCRESLTSPWNESNSCTSIKCFHVYIHACVCVCACVHIYKEISFSVWITGNRSSLFHECLHFAWWT